MRGAMPIAEAASPPALLKRVESRFGLVPNFFQSARAAPEVIEKLWDFACAAYLDNPIPSLFKERLFVYLSRFCDVRYCILRHCAFLLGYGYAAGDPDAAVQSVEQAIRLLTMPTPWERDMDEICRDLASLDGGHSWPEPETMAESWIIAAAALTFVEPSRAEQAREALRRAVGARPFEHLMGLLTFVRAAHFWTKLHPDIESEDDVRAMLLSSEKLRELLLADPEAGRCDMSVQLFAEFESLRELHERRELERANRELTQRAEEKGMLLNEIHHRVKNSLQIVSSVLHMQLPRVKDPEAAELLRSSETRVRAIAAVHERLYRDDDISSIDFESYLRGLCDDVARAYDAPEAVIVETCPVAISRDQAISLALIVNELVTNAFRHGGRPCRVQLHDGGPESFCLTVCDTGHGPSEDNVSGGLGTRLIESLCRQLDATLEKYTDESGYRCTLVIPHQSGAASAARN